MMLDKKSDFNSSQESTKRLITACLLKLIDAILPGSTRGIEYRNSVFTLKPYSEVECDCDFSECKNESNCPCNEPNFHHPSSGLSVTWYKYPGRGMEIDGECDFQKILEVFLECYKSVVSDASMQYDG